MSKKKPVAPTATPHVMMRMASRLNRMPQQMRAGYVERAKARLKGANPTMNDAGLLAAVGS